MAQWDPFACLFFPRPLTLSTPSFLRSSKKNWADDAGDEDEVLPPTEVIGPDASGIKTVISYINEDGRIVKVTRKFKVSKVTHTVHKRVAARKAWAKFGDEAGRKPGPDPSTTTLSEHIPVKLSLKQSAAEEEEAISAMDALKKQGDKVVVCRVCKGDHWTSKCPYKDSLGALTEAVAEATAAVQAEPGAPSAALFTRSFVFPMTRWLMHFHSAAAPSAGGKYVPPSLRAGAAGVAGRKGESPYGRTRGTASIPSLHCYFVAIFHSSLFSCCLLSCYIPAFSLSLYLSVSP